jgi:hypothetical protein
MNGRLPWVRRRRRTHAPLIVAVTVVSAAGAAVIGILRRRARDPHGRRPWTCACGQRYLVRGTDRHRVYWLTNASQRDPVLGRECVSCGATLPAQHDLADATAGDASFVTPATAQYGLRR